MPGRKKNQRGRSANVLLPGRKRCCQGKSCACRITGNDDWPQFDKRSIGGNSIVEGRREWVLRRKPVIGGEYAKSGGAGEIRRYGAMCLCLSDAVGASVEVKYRRGSIYLLRRPIFTQPFPSNATKLTILNLDATAR